MSAHLKARPKQDLARYRRLIAACESAAHGDRAEIAERFDCPSLGALKARLHRARRIVAEARA